MSIVAVQSRKGARRRFVETRPQEASEFQETLDRCLDPGGTVPRSQGSQIADATWSFLDETNERQSAYAAGTWKIHWDTVELRVLGNDFVEFLREFAVARIGFNRQFFGYYGSKAEVNPRTLKRDVRYVSRFLALAMLHRFGDYAEAHSAFELGFDDLQSAAAEFRRNTTLLCGLRHLAEPLLLAHFDRTLNWKRADVDRLAWEEEDAGTTEAPHGEPWNQSFDSIPSVLWGRLSNRAISDVKQFLRAIDIGPEDTTPVGETQSWVLDEVATFSARWRDALARPRPKRIAGTDQFREIYPVLYRARSAAELVIAMYTGARLSELRSFKVGCCRKRGADWVVHGTVIKHRPLSDPVDCDVWLVARCVVDAVRVLEEVNALSSKPRARLFGAKTCSTTELYKRWQEYVVSLSFEIDPGGRWPDLRINQQKLRNSLALELNLVGVGYPAISYQLQHDFEALGHWVDVVTGHYGGIGKWAPVQAAVRARERVLREVFHPDAIIAGLGAEAHKSRVREYFRGQTADEIDRALYAMSFREGVSFVDVGLAVCAQRGPKDGDTPCRGQMSQCVPQKCGRALIPITRKRNWKQSLEADQQRRNNPAYAHAWSRLDEAIAEKQEVIASLEAEEALARGDA